MAPYYDGLLAFLFRQLFYSIPDVPSVDLSGKTALVTGANSGIGYSLAMKLATQGAQVIMAVRSVAKGEAARKMILEKVPEARIEIKGCDLASFDSVMMLINEISRESRSFDLVVLNAGVWSSELETSSDGIDISIQVSSIAISTLI